MGDSLKGKTALALGVANQNSIAWGIVQAWKEAGANLVLTYQGDRLQKKVAKLAEELGDGVRIAPCDVTVKEEIDALFASIERTEGRLDALLHSIAFAPKESLEGRFVDTTKEAFTAAHQISVFSLIELAQRAKPLMKDGGSIVSLSYYGAEKVIPNYNVMGVAKAALEASTRYLAADLGPEGIRVNCLSAGPVNTLAARGISGFSSMLARHQERAPLRRNVELSELGAAALFLASDASTAITGQTIYVDCGYQIMGM